MNTLPKTRSTLLWSAMMMVAFVLLPAAGQSQEMLARSSDKEVKALVKDIEKAEKKFEKALDSKFKRSIVRGASGEVNVANYLEDLSDSIDNLEKRFTGSYAASAEAAEVLDRSSLMHGYIRNNPSLKGANEWDGVATLLQQLAIVYGTEFPLPEGAVVRRIGDGELVDAANALKKFSGSFDSVLKKATSKIADLKDPVKAGMDDLKSISSASKTLASRIKSGKPASAEARQLMEAVERVQTLVNMDGMPDSLAAEWQAGAAPVDTISQAFGLAASN
jgi:hypothetical protein